MLKDAFAGSILKLDMAAPLLVYVPLYLPAGYVMQNSLLPKVVTEN